VTRPRAEVLHTHPNPKVGRNEPVAILVPGWDCSSPSCPFKRDKAVGDKSCVGPTTASLAGKPTARRKSGTGAVAASR
jgi:hypothetical protein